MAPSSEVCIALCRDETDRRKPLETRNELEEMLWPLTALHIVRVLCQTPSVCGARARLTPTVKGEAAILEGGPWLAQPDCICLQQLR